MNPPTEVSKKEIISLAIAKMGDNQQTWEYLKKLDIVRPRQRKMTFTVTTEIPENRYRTDPQNWDTQQLGRALYNSQLPTATVTAEDTSESEEGNSNAGSVPMEKLIEVAKEIKKDQRYCWIFWETLNQEFGVPLPEQKALRVSFVLPVDLLRENEVDPDNEISLSLLKEILEDVDSLEDYSVAPA